MLGVRLLGAAAILAPLIALLWADYAIGPLGVWLLPLCLAIIWAALSEVLNLQRACGLDPLAWVAYSGSTLVFLSAAGPLGWYWRGLTYPPDCPLGRLGWQLAAMAAAIGLAGMGELWRFREPGRATVNLAASIFAIAYIGLLGSFLAPLRLLQMDNRLGMIALVSMLFVVKMSDAGAYLVGRTTGRTKLAPRLSPGKTVEGALGGLLVGCLAAWLFFGVLTPAVWGGEIPGTIAAWLGYGLTIGLAGLLGDLFESLLKRDAHQKDSSHWLPGLGGVLDVLDSVLFAAPAAFLYWATFLGG